MNKKLIFTVLIAVLVASCANNETENLPQSGNELRLTATMDVQTKATATDFESGDYIGVYAMAWSESTPSQQPAFAAPYYAENVKHKWNGSGFNNEGTAIYWPLKECKLDIYAYYPYSETGLTEDGKLTFNVQTNQSTESNYTGSDLLTAHLTGNERTKEALNLPFKHALSKVTFTLTAGDGYTTDELRTLTLTLKQMNTSATIDLGKTSDEEGFINSPATPADIKATADYKAIVIPQVKVVGEVLFTLENATGETEVTCKAEDKKNDFESGKQYNYTVKISRVGVKLTAEIIGWEVQPIGQEASQAIELSTDNGNLSDDALSFNTGDKAGLFATRWATADAEETAVSFLTNHELTWNTTDGFTGTAIYWPSAKRKVNFYAYAPYQQTMTMSSTSIPISVNADQTTTATTDWLTCYKAGVAPTSGKIVLNFSHALSQIHVTFSYGEGYEGDPINTPSVKLTGTCITADFDIAAQTAKLPTGATSTPISLKAGEENLTFSGFLIPQTVSAGSKLMEIYDSENKLAAVLTLNKNKTFKAGEDYQITVNLKKQAIGFKADITKWQAVDWGTADAKQEWE